MVTTQKTYTQRARKALKKTCWCGAYPFPHRVGSGRCRKRKADNPAKRIKKARTRRWNRLKH